MASQLPPFRFPTQDSSDVELIVEVPVRAGVAVNGSSELEAAFGSPHPQCPQHRLVWQEPVKGSAGALAMRRIYRRLPGTALVGQTVRATSWGAAATTTVQEVPTGTAADTGLNVIESVVDPTDAQTARKRTVSVDWPVLTSRSVESETGTPVTETRQVVAAGAALPADGPLVIDRKINAVNKWRSIQIVTSLDALPAAYTEQKKMSYRFPGLFYGFDATGGGSVSKRSAFSRTVTARVEVSFGYVEVVPEILAIVPVSWSYPLNLDAADVLTNGESFTYLSDKVTVTETVPQSTPTRAAYEALMGTYATVSGASERWKGNVWRTELWKIKLL